LVIQMLNKYYSWKIKRNIKMAGENTDVVRELNNVNEALILCFEKNESIMNFTNEMQKFYPKAKVSTWVYSDLSEKMRHRKNGVKKNIGQEMNSTKYDLIIDLFETREFPWMLFVSSLSGRLKVCIGKNDLFAIYNLVLNVQQTSEDKYGLLMEYLRKVRGELSEEGL
jgi:hypothetical protein